MSTYEVGKLYLIDLRGETHQATCRRYPDGAVVFLTYDGAVISGSKAENPRLAIALDPEDENVKVMVDIWANDRDLSAARSVARLIAAQITPPEPPMEEPTEWNAPVTDDRGDWSRAEGEAPGDTLRWAPRDWTKADWSTWDQMRNPRPYENPREKPATAPQSDAQGSGSGIGRVSESEGPEAVLHQRDDGDRWVISHHSLDRRETRE